MTNAELAAAGAENLRRTYINLGLAVPGTERIQEEGFAGCLGTFEHAVCNFAAGLSLDPWSARRLRELALSRPAFHIYSLSDDRPAHRAELLERQGFRISYRLVQMGAEPGDPGPYVELSPAESVPDRLKVAAFMGTQFFSRQASAFRQRVATATAHATDLALYELVERHHRLGAVMLCQTENSVGLYNLCIAAARRGKGLGRSIVGWARAKAAAEGLPVCLQCDARLAGWYEHLGFRRIGIVDVYSLDKMQQPDIMN
ncbi:MAG: GNAT family N-acetyltransferase [Fimbriimonas sp.]